MDEVPSITVSSFRKVAAFKMPGRTAGSPPLKEGPLATITVDVNSMVGEKNDAMDWDRETGKPSKKKLLELGLDDIAKELRSSRKNRQGETVRWP